MIIRIILTLSIPLTIVATSSADQSASSQAQHRLFLDTADGQLDQFSLFQAAMLCTAPDARVPTGWQRRFQWHAEQCARLIPANTSSDQRAELVFRYLHDQILTSGYNENTNCVLQTLQSGNFNCITSTLLYICLCRECGLNARAVAVPNHVLVRLPLPAGPLVETTHPSFTLLNPHDRRIPQIHLSQELSDVALLGRLYYNQAIRLAHQNQYAQALTAASRSCQLDRFDSSARVNMLATINNWAIALCAQGDYPQAAHLVLRGLLIDSNYGPLTANDVYVHQKWITALRRHGNHLQADQISKELQGRILERNGG